MVTAPIRCDNCGHALGEHCSIHVIPCCPGKCVIDLSPGAFMEFDRQQSR